MTGWRVNRQKRGADGAACGTPYAVVAGPVKLSNDGGSRRSIRRGLWRRPAAKPADLAGEYPAVEYTPPHGRYSMDILSRLGEAFRYESLEREEVDLDGVRVTVATPSML